MHSLTHSLTRSPRLARHASPSIAPRPIPSARLLLWYTHHPEIPLHSMVCKSLDRQCVTQTEGLDKNDRALSLLLLLLLHLWSFKSRSRCISRLHRAIADTKKGVLMTTRRSSSLDLRWAGWHAIQPASHCGRGA